MKKLDKRYFRHSMRLNGHDYCTPGNYFITICTKNKFNHFGNIEKNILISTRIGLMVHDAWLSLPKRFPDIILGEFVVMPDHIHGIIRINNRVSGIANNSFEEKSKHGIPEYIQYYKRKTTHLYHQIAKRNPVGADSRIGPLWQRNYYDKIIRTQREYINISKYIRNNPTNHHPSR